ncbi:DUF4401 domain-containing protein [Candidatus Berkiella cookevillensis]|uniref:DUF4401 domain-containing protein n=1 Tax=Candidatus Berkiella cookevillensis TaxID=437022 RepID=A0A0Q9YGH8_9GAMM|nr:hypothetical protein [Candidatus Berkiella cookevillensis]MCS5707666.1 DUF4401 domain-containing protein [Candidatus Berkiella cookevillensis]
MKIYDLQSFFDLLETKGLLKKRNSAEIAILCQLNAESRLSMKIIFFYGITVIFHACFFMGLYANNIINLHHIIELFSLGLLLTLLSGTIYYFMRQLAYDYFMLSVFIYRITLLSSHLLILFALHAIPDHNIAITLTKFGIFALFSLISYGFYRDMWVRFSSILLLNIYLFIAILPEETSHLALCFLSAITCALFLLPVTQKLLRPMLYANIATIVLEIMNLVLTQSISDIHHSHALLVAFAQVGLSIIAIAHIISLRKNALKPIDTPIMVLLIVSSIIASVISPYLSMSLIFILIGYRTVNALLMFTGAGLLAFLIASSIYSADALLLTKALSLMGLGLVFCLIKKMIHHYQWHIEK